MKNMSYVLLALSSIYLFAVQNTTEHVEEVSIEHNLSEVRIALVKQKVGAPYAYAQAGPNSFDCSGFVYYLFKEQNISIARSSLEQSKEGIKLSRSEIKRGDILFFDTSQKGHVNHSGIYLGEGKFIHASSGKANGVTVSDLNQWYKDKFKWGIRK